MSQQNSNNALQISQNISVEAKITTADIADLAVSDREEQLITARDSFRSDLQKAKEARNKIAQSLEQAGDKLANTAIKPDVKSLAKKLTSFSGNKYLVKLDSTRVDLEKGVVTTDVRIELEKDTSYRSREIKGVTREETIPFSPAMKKAKAKLVEATNVVNHVEQQLNNVRTELSNLPRLARKAKAAIVRAQLLGKVVDGSDLLNCVTDLKPKQLR